ncbi:hypothetical protein [Citreimonas sp.]|uniref:hypothetical protein n=1 Tax=Citreimonas sp. TaxID=3036715 RepID=UPI0035C83E8B
MFTTRSPARDTLEHLDRIEAWVRARFSVPDDQIVLVSEERGRVPGFPPRLTTVLFWMARDERYRFRVFKPAAQVDKSDLPLAWLRPALIDDGDADCC